MNRTIAIIGNPNSGKTTLFNRLTGSNQHVGNWPGVTVDRKTGHICYQSHTVDVVDLPGIYSLSPFTQEEIIAREYVLSDAPDGILNIVDATNIERNLYLTMQLIALGLPMVIALNFIDDCRAQGIEINCEALSETLGVRVIPISARKGENMDKLLGIVTGGMQKPAHQPAYLHGVGAAIGKVARALEETQLRRENLPFYALKLLEGDSHVLQTVTLPPAAQKTVETTAAALSSHGCEDNEMILADALYDFIEETVRRAVKRPEKPVLTLTERLDRVIINKWLALPIFALLMVLMFWSTFGPIGSFFAGLFETLIHGVLMPAVQNGLRAAGASGWIVGLVCDGVLGGVGGVISFLPQIIILFFFLSLLEDTGYLARIAFIMDTLLRRIGLSGKSFVPMLMGFGCTTPAVMAARTMENEKDRRMTIMLTPFMSCGAKLPVYALFAGAIFPQCASFIIISLYVLGILVGIFAGWLLKKTVFRGVSSGFVLELPPYRLPTARGTLQNMWEKAKDFITKAGTVIFVMSIVVWLLQNFTPTLQTAVDSSDSILGVFGRCIAPIFSPLGFGEWRASVSILTGIIAKEAVVSTMSVLYGVDLSALGGLLSTVFSPVAAYTFLVFILLYMPCTSAFATIKREMGGWKWAVGAAAFQTGLAWVVSCLVYQIGSLVFRIL